MIALQNDYSGKGNTSRRIAIAERTQDTLHYKSKRALPFSSFLDKRQKMFNIFDKQDESIPDSAKVCLLLKKVEPQSAGTLRVQSAIDGITFTVCVNLWLHWSQNYQISNLLRKSPAPIRSDQSTRVLTKIRRRAITTKAARTVPSAKGFTCLMALSGQDILMNGVRCWTRTSKLSWTPGKRKAGRTIN